MTELMQYKDAAFSIVLLAAILYVITQAYPVVIKWKELDNAIREKELQGNKEVEQIRNSCFKDLASMFNDTQLSMTACFKEGVQQLSTKIDNQQALCMGNSKNIERILDRTEIYRKEVV